MGRLAGLEPATGSLRDCCSSRSVCSKYADKIEMKGTGLGRTCRAGWIFHG